MAKTMIADTLQQNRLVRGGIFLGATLFPIVVLVSFVLLPVLDEFSARDAEIVQRKDRLARLKGIAAFDPEGLRTPVPADQIEHYLTGPNEGLVSAKLQIRLKRIVQASGTQLRLIQGLPAQIDGKLELIGVRLNLVGPIQAIHKAISTIENGTPLLFITSATLKSVRQTRNVATHQPREPLLEAQLEVFGTFRTGEAQ